MEMDDEDEKEVPPPPIDVKSKTPTSTLHSKRHSKDKVETPIGGKSKRDYSPASIREKSKQDTSAKRLEEYAVRVDSEEAYTQKGENAEARRVGSNEDI